jgi:hypothetical protein
MQNRFQLIGNNNVCFFNVSFASVSGSIPTEILVCISCYINLLQVVCGTV